MTRRACALSAWTPASLVVGSSSQTLTAGPTLANNLSSASCAASRGRVPGLVTQLASVPEDNASWKDDACPVQHLHEVAAGYEQDDAAVPGGDHACANNLRPPVISP